MVRMSTDPGTSNYVEWRIKEKPFKKRSSVSQTMRGAGVLPPLEEVDGTEEHPFSDQPVPGSLEDVPELGLRAPRRAIPADLPRGDGRTRRKSSSESCSSTRGPAWGSPPA
jgi:hypothetical protein